MSFEPKPARLPKPQKHPNEKEAKIASPVKRVKHSKSFQDSISRRGRQESPNYMSPTQCRINSTSPDFFLSCPKCERRVNESFYQSFHESPPRVRPSHHNIVCEDCSEGSYSKVLKVVCLNESYSNASTMKKVKVIESLRSTEEPSKFPVIGNGRNMQVHFQEVFPPPKPELTSLIPESMRENGYLNHFLREEERKRVTIRRAEYANRVKGISKTIVTTVSADPERSDYEDFLKANELVYKKSVGLHEKPKAKDPAKKKKKPDSDSLKKSIESNKVSVKHKILAKLETKDLEKRIGITCTEEVPEDKESSKGINMEESPEFEEEKGWVVEEDSFAGYEVIINQPERRSQEALWIAEERGVNDEPNEIIIIGSTVEGGYKDQSADEEEVVYTMKIDDFQHFEHQKSEIKSEKDITEGSLQADDNREAEILLNEVKNQVEVCHDTHEEHKAGSNPDHAEDPNSFMPVFKEPAEEKDKEQAQPEDSVSSPTEESFIPTEKSEDNPQTLLNENVSQSSDSPNKQKDEENLIVRNEFDTTAEESIIATNLQDSFSITEANYNKVMLLANEMISEGGFENLEDNKGDDFIIHPINLEKIIEDAAEEALATLSHRKEVKSSASSRELVEDGSHEHVLLHIESERKICELCGAESKTPAPQETEKLDVGKLNILFSLITDPQVIKGLKLLGGFADYLEKHGKDILDLKMHL